MIGESSKKKAGEILKHFQLIESRKNIDYLVQQLSSFRGGKKVCKVVSVDSNGNKKKLFMSIFECSQTEGIKYTTLEQAIRKKTVVRKTGLKYCKIENTDISCS